MDKLRKNPLWIGFVLTNLAVFIFSIHIITIQSHSVHRMKAYNSTLVRASVKFKKILLFNHHSRPEFYYFGTGHEAFVNNRCPIDTCEVVTAVSQYPITFYDAILFNAAGYGGFPDLKRTSSQRYILVSQESPFSIPRDVIEKRNYFNWTMTYRLDSDIGLRYGRVNLLDRNSERKVFSKINPYKYTKNYAANKTKLVAWFVSHCPTHSKREIYVGELKKYIDVDVYGSCGNLSCSRNGRDWISHNHCYDMLEQDYKFYLSFENAICNDYVTEKFFSVLERNVLPIVYSGGDYSAIAPPHSYIDALQFSPQELAEYLHLLARNDHLYNEYFWWKDVYAVEAGINQMAVHAFCDLCSKLHTDDIPKSYPKINFLWDYKIQCREISFPYKTKGNSTVIVK